MFYRKCLNLNESASLQGAPVIRQCLTAVLVASIPLADAIASEPVTISVYNNEVEASIELANGIAADVTVSFEQATGLSATAIGIDAELVDPGDPMLLARLPASLVSVPAAFPLLLTIEPPAEGGLSFLGVATVEIHTHNLGYSVGSPFRLYVAEDGGEFEDITDQAGSGSYRVRGSQGEFSEFMIVADLRAATEAVQEKYARLDGILSANRGLVNSNLYSDLTTLLSASYTAYKSADEVTAIQTLDDFSALVRSNAGGAVPNMWRSRDDIVNLDGLLRAATSTLRYSLTLLANDLP